MDASSAASPEGPPSETGPSKSVVVVVTTVMVMVMGMKVVVSVESSVVAVETGSA